MPTCCSTRPTGHTTGQDSKSCWMKVQWQVTSLPAGVNWEDASQILPKEHFVFYRQQNPALGSNLFRYRLLERRPGIWLDTDVLLMKPILAVGGQLFGWQDHNLINNAVLCLPCGSPILKDLIQYTSTYFPIPPFFSKRRRLMLVALKAIGRPVHVSQMPWGVWGPNALTYFVRSNGMEHQAVGSSVFYPIPYEHCLQLVEDNIHTVEQCFSETTVAVHLWHSNLRRLTYIASGGRCREPEIKRDSFLEYFCRTSLGLRLT